MHIVWLKTELLHPLDKGGRLRTHGMLRELCRTCQVTYVAPVDRAIDGEAMDKADGYCTRLVAIEDADLPRSGRALLTARLRALPSRVPAAVAPYESARVRQVLSDLLATEHPDETVLVCDFLAPCLNVPPGGRIASVLFQHNVEAEIWRRRADSEFNLLLRAMYRREWRKMERFEAERCRAFDAVVAVSARDAGAFRSRYALKAVHEVPTGVDTDYFAPRSASRAPATLVFVGSMDWQPNVDGIRWFVREVLPRIVAGAPSARLMVVGRHPSSSLAGELEGHRNVELVGTVPDVRPYLAEATLSIVPLRIGGGTRLKVFEAMAMKCPVVSTTIGAEGLPLQPGRHLRIGDAPSAFAEHVLALMQQPDEAATLAAEAHQLVVARFGWRAAAEAFLDACTSTLAGTRNRH